MKTQMKVLALALIVAGFAGQPSANVQAQDVAKALSSVQYHTVEIEGVEVFYREAGSRDNPTILLLHGFPTSSHMFRELIPALANEYHVVAPDYPGFGRSEAPPVDQFEYTFDNFADIVGQLTERLELGTYSVYLMDYGAPVGYRLAAKHPERVDALVVQNGNAYDEGLLEFWDPIRRFWADRTPENGDALRGLLTLDATKWQYLTGVRDPKNISPDNWGHVQPLLDRAGNQEIQLQLFYDYSSNLPLYPEWQAYFRQHQPPTLIVWGKNDPIFPAEGAHPYKRDLHNLEFHLLDTGHFALEEELDFVAATMRKFLARELAS